MEKVLNKCSNGDCSLLQSPNAALTLFPQKLLGALEVNNIFQRTVDTKNFSDDKWKKVINSVYNGTSPAELNLSSEVENILLKFKSACQCCDCTREKVENLIQNGCKPNCPTHKKDKDEVMFLSHAKEMFNEKLLTLMNELGQGSELPPRDIQLLSRCLSSQITKNHSNINFTPQFTLAMQALQKCRGCYSDILNFSKKDNEDMIIVDDKLYPNPRFAEMTGYSMDELQKMTLGQFNPVISQDEIFITGKNNQKIPVEFSVLEKSLNNQVHKIITISPEKNITVTLQDNPLLEEEIIKPFRDKIRYLRKKNLSLRKEYISLKKAIQIHAHDTNNMVTGLRGLIDLNKKNFSEDYELLNQEINRMKTGSARLLDRCRPSRNENSSQLESVNLANFLYDIIGYHQELLPNIPINFNKLLDQYISIDPYRMRDALDNLIINAQEALPEKGGEITINLDVVDIYDDETRFSPKIPDGSYITISVKDNGHGILPEKQGSIFKTFVTTKGERRGRGIGMTSIQEAVEDHDGFLDLKSATGENPFTEFTILLPNKESYALLKKEAEKELLSLRGIPIIVVDNEELILNLMKRIIKNKDGHCQTASNPRECLELIKDAPENTVLILDYNLGSGVDSIELARSIKADRPDIIIMLFTGAPPEDGPELIKEGVINDVLQKPSSEKKVMSKIFDQLTKPIVPSDMPKIRPPKLYKSQLSEDGVRDDQIA